MSVFNVVSSYIEVVQNLEEAVVSGGAGGGVYGRIRLEQKCSYTVPTKSHRLSSADGGPESNTLDGGSNKSLVWEYKKRRCYAIASVPPTVINSLARTIIAGNKSLLDDDEHYRAFVEEEADVQAVFAVSVLRDWNCSRRLARQIAYWHTDVSKYQPRIHIISNQKKYK